MSMGEYNSIFDVNVNIFMVGKQEAPLADKILRGIPAGKIPVVSTESFLQINYKAIKELDLNINQGLLVKTDEIIR